MNSRELDAIMLMGKSERIRDKPFIKVKGKELFRYGYEILSNVFGNVLIVCEKGIEKRLIGYNIVMEDHGIGPLGAIYEGAKNTTSRYIFVTGCDMPLLLEKVIEFLCDEVERDGIVPIYEDGNIEPLHAIYKRKKILGLNILKKGGRIAEMIKEMDVKFISVNEIRKYDPGLLTFRNINTERDINEIKEYLG